MSTVHKYPTHNTIDQHKTLHSEDPRQQKQATFTESITIIITVSSVSKWWLRKNIGEFVSIEKTTEATFQGKIITITQNEVNTKF